MEAFKHKLISLGLFSTVLRNVPLEGNNEIDIPYIPLATSASKDFDGTYKFDKGDMESRKITVNRRKYQSLTYTSEEKARQPYFDPVTLGRLKGAKLAEDVLLDILSVITAENFGDAILTRNAADFDTDDIIDLETKIDELEWPDSPRGMLLKSSYMANVKKDIKTSGGLSTFGFSPLGELPNLMGFSFSKFNRLPDNGEKLQGFIVYPSAIMVALAPIAPTANVMKQLSTYLSSATMGSALVKRRHSNVSYLNKMNAFITIGYKKNGKSEILLSPDEPYAKHRQLFKTLTGDYTDVEVWSRAMGKIKQRKVKTSKVAKVSKTSKESKE